MRSRIRWATTHRIMFLLAAVLAIAIPQAEGSPISSNPQAAPGGEVPVFGYTVLDSFPHDPHAFTQGLIYRDGFLYESTGLYGGSSLRKVVLETGEVVKHRSISAAYFAEGLTMFENLLYQLTWQSHVGFIYQESDEFELLDTFTYDTPGWGLTHDDASLIMSDGTDRLYYLDPVTYEVTGTVQVTADGAPVYNLNELEMIEARIYANIWYSDSIAVIDPWSGEVTAWVDLAGILAGPAPGVLNGIAFDPTGRRLLVTGKNWPTVFEIWTDALDSPPEILGQSLASPLCAYIGAPVHLSVIASDADPGDSLRFTWSVNGAVEPAAVESTYEYMSLSSAVDTVTVDVTDGIRSVSAAWIIYVEIGGIDDRPRGPEGSEAVLWQNRPNPFVPATDIRFKIPEARGACLVSLTIYDVSGRRVATLLDSEVGPGEHTITWDARDDRGRRLPPGIFIYVLDAGETRLSRKITVLD